ncbi:MAG TPA: SHOCT domain-containing protein [Actinomycetota bacterium]|jgi:uncharacterized membrane protein|nr:SHOCT domain-containing protein [Actinomycetota bacterium]
MTHMDGMWMGPMMWAMWLPSIVLLAALIGFGVWAVRRFTERGSRTSARQILEERLARGEIDTEEFETRLRALER